MVDTTKTKKKLDNKDKDNRIKRLFLFASLLKNDGNKNATDIAKELKVSKRTVFRDLNTLRSAGVVVSYNSSESSYHIDHSIFPYELLPNPDDLAELLLQASVSAFPSTDRKGQKVKRATETLMKFLPDDLKKQQSLLISTMRKIKSIDDDRRQKKLNVIQQSITTGKCLWLEVNSEKMKKNTAWIVHPDGMSFDEGTFFLIGTLQHLHKSLKISVEKIQKIEISDKVNSNPCMKSDSRWTNPDIVIK